MVLKKILESPLDSKEIKPVNPKGNPPKWSLKGLMMKLKFQYFGYLMGRTDSLGKTLLLGKIESRRRMGLQRIKWLNGITNSMDMIFSKHHNGNTCAVSSVQLLSTMDCSMPDLTVHHQLPKFTWTHVHWVGDAIQLSHPLLSPFPPAYYLSQHQGLLKWVSSSH